MTERSAVYKTNNTHNAQAQVYLTRIEPRLGAYKKVLEGALLMATGIYELVTGEKAPKHRDILSL